MSDFKINNIPANLFKWIEKERLIRKMSREEFVVSILNEVHEERQQYLFASDVDKDTSLISKNLPFKFIDLFAGIGGFRLAFEKLGGKCVFSSEWDRYSQKTYTAWFDETPHGDIRKIKPIEIPDHDILAAGFPCQPFSIAGVSKKKSLGKAHGFKDATQGTLFFNLATIIEIKRPPVLFLENVKNLQSHDQGRTWDVINKTLEDLDYWVFDKIIDAVHWVPQHRERVYIICFDKKVFINKPLFTYPEPPKGEKPKLISILEQAVDKKYTLTDHLWKYLQEYSERHRAKGNGFGYGLANVHSNTRTLSARYYKDGSEILVPQKGKNPRRLTPRECARLMSFDDKLAIVVSDTQAYRQFGNAVVTRVVEEVGKQVLLVLNKYFSEKENCLIK